MAPLALTPRSIPKINGSSRGFIALVVCLSLIIVGSCIGVYILLRDNHQSDEEIARKAARSSSSQPSSPTYAYRAKYLGNTPVPLTTKIRRLLPFNLGGVPNNRGRRWSRAGSGDDWGYESGGSQTGTMTELSPPRRPGLPRTNTNDSETPTLDNLPLPKPSLSFHKELAPSLRTSSSYMTTVSSFPSRPHSRSTSPIPTESRHMSDITLAMLEDPVTFTTHSGPMKLFASGTKFSEGL